MSEFSKEELVFSEAEIAEIEKHIAKYPEKKSAVMPTLWIAQEKFACLADEVIKLVAETLDLPFAHVYGVANFYTMYFKKPFPRNVIEVCTCFTCSVCGGDNMYDKLRDKLQIDENNISADKQFMVREAECLGACDTAPVAQVNNRRYVHRLTDDKLDELIEKMRNGKTPEYEQIPLSDQTIYNT